MLYKTAFILQAIGIILPIILLIISLIVLSKKKTAKTPIIARILTIICLSITCICIGLSIYTNTIYQTAKKHGMYDDNITIAAMKNSTKLSHTESKLPDDISGAIIIYYKFGCVDCEAIHNDLNEKIGTQENVYWVSTKSEQGEKLLETYAVEEVPTGIYIRKNDYDGNIKYTQYKLFKASDDADAILDTTAIDRLLYLQSDNR